MFDDLTKGGKKTLALIYKRYLERLKSGIDIDHAVRCGSSRTIQEELMPDAKPADVDHWCRELGRIGYLSCYYADDIAYMVFLSDAGIRDSENKFTKGTVDVLSFLAQFIP